MVHIIADNLTVEYVIHAHATTSLQKAIVSRATGGRVFRETGEPIRVRAIDGISFKLEEGDRLGLVGPNGAGKSTLIRTLAGFLDPVAGSVEIKGKVTALLSVGAGMDLERTGRENIYHLGLFYLITPSKMEQHVDDIVDFAELGEFIDLPVRTYSDGMRVRLAFAIATCLKPEVLLLDEAIGAGDARFAAKAQERAKSLYQSARIMVMASHAVPLLKQLCNKGVYMEKGQIKAFGPIDDVLKAYAASTKDPAPAVAAAG